MIKFLFSLFSCLTFLLVFNQPAQAKPAQKMLCSAVWAYRLKDRIPTDGSDKLKHCSMSCWLARRCPDAEVFSIGVVKELADLMGMGNPEWRDIEANMHGIQLAMKVKSDQGCVNACRKRHP